MIIRTIVVNFFLCAVLAAQATRSQNIPLRNWAPPLWQPAQSATVQSASAHALPTSLIFVAMPPCRVVDTRAGQSFPAPFGTPALMPGPARSFPIQSSTLCSIPSVARAYSFNVTVVPPGPLGYLTIWPTGQSQPNAVTLDDLLGTIVNNGAVVPAGTPNGSVSVVVNAATDLVIDINSYYAPPDTTDNTANGVSALLSNTSGANNTANGYGALISNSTGSFNTANGSLALDSNTAGNDNTADGYQALFNNTIGTDNTGSGFAALFHQTDAGYNTADGYKALFNNNGSRNTASGAAALFSNASGQDNIAIGFEAGFVITGSNNIDIGNLGGASDGLAANSGVIRIGNSPAQTSFFAAGIRGVTTGQSGAVTVMIDSNGQLGTISSSRRFKEDIQDMGRASSGLLRLRPVTYRYQQPYADGSKPLDYGLIAEEVADVYPDLVVKGADGQAETVQYHKLTPMLLNELQKEHETVLRLQAQVSALQARQEALEKALEHSIAGREQTARKESESR